MIEGSNKSRMSVSIVVPDNRCHVLSTSMPAKSHPVMLRVEEGMHKLKACATSSSSTTRVFCDGLRGLGELYDSIEELLTLPHNQQVFVHEQQKKWVEEELDVSVRMLDVCNAMRDNFATIREHVQDLHLALRKRGDTAHISSGKRAQKNIKDCLRALKQLNNTHTSHPTLDRDGDFCVRLILIQARDITMSLFRSILSLLSISRAKSKASKWSFFSKSLNKRRVACEGELEDASEERRANISFSAFYEYVSCKDVDETRSLKVQSQLEELEVTIGNLESGFECFLRRLIQNRVSLLNILSL